MSSIEENQCIDSSLLVSEYPEDAERGSGYGVRDSSIPEARVPIPASPAYSGAQCTPDTYVDASGLRESGIGNRGSSKEVHDSRSTIHDPRSPIHASDVPTLELSDFGPLAPVVAVAAVVLGGLGASCGPSSGGGGNGDGGFRFGDDDGGDDDQTDGRTDVQTDDVDGDGYPADMDCDDTDATVHPRAEETPYDGIDQDCNGEDLVDVDGDGFPANPDPRSPNPDLDCNDDQAYIHPGAEQRLTDFDTNCDDSLEIDLDRDSVKFEGESVGAGFGLSMALGDVNGDGYGDVIVSGGPSVLFEEDGAGKAYIFFGGAATLAPGTTLNAADADVTINGACGWGLGGEVVGKDLDGDGTAELLIGVTGFNNRNCDDPYNVGDSSRSGAIFVFQGRESWDENYDFYEIDATNEAELAEHQIGIIKGPNNLRLGGNILVTGDIDGDGVGQIVAGRQNSCDVIPARVYEGINRIDQVRDSEGGYHIHNSTGTPFNGDPCDQVASGDLNDDGLADLVFGDAADDFHEGEGRIFTLFGSDDLPSDINLYSLETYSGLNYLQFSGNGPAYGAGGALALGDVDGDGKDELMIGVSGDDNPMERSGRVYCVPGASITEVIEGDNPSFENGDTIVLNGDVMSLGGLSFYATAANANIPYSLAVADTASDGMGDLLIGAGAAVEYPGSIVGGKTFYFGSSIFSGGSMTSEISVMEADIEVTLATTDGFGDALTGGGDVNGDGVEDVLINAPRAPEQSLRGTTYLLFGGSW